MLQTGEQIGPYTLVRQLGRGAFGLVWLAERRGAFATTQVALKLALDDEPNLAALAQESRLWAQLGGHNNVLPIIEADKYGDYMVLVSEYAPDGSLEGWLKKHGGVAPSIEAAVAMTIGILNGLEHLHSKKVIHRDLKPANILLQGDIPRLADFGLARVLKSTMQSTGVAGTPAYMAPEVFSGERFVQSDLWSVGVILYQMLSGRLPFPQIDIMALLGAIAHRNPEPLPNYIPVQLTQIITQALQKDITKRFQSAAEMRNTLQQIISIGAINVTRTELEDDKPTAIFDTLPEVGVGQMVETLPEISKNTNDKKTWLTNENTIEQLRNSTTQKQVEPLTVGFTQSGSVVKAKPAITKFGLKKKDRHTKYETLVVGVVMVVMLSFTFFKGSSYNSVSTSNVDKDQMNVIAVDPESPIDPESSVDPESSIDTENIVNSYPTSFESTNEENEGLREKHDKLLGEIDGKSADLAEQIDQMSDNSKKKSLEKRFVNIREKLEDKFLDTLSLNSITLYQAYLMNLESLVIEAKSYITKPNIQANLSKKADKESLKIKSNLDEKTRLLERKVNNLPEGKEKTELIQTCSTVRKGIDRIAVASKLQELSSYYQAYNIGLDKLLNNVGEISVKNNSLVVKDKDKQNIVVITKEPPAPPKPTKSPDFPQFLIENNNNSAEIKVKIPYSLTNPNINPSTLKKLIGMKILPGFEFSENNFTFQTHISTEEAKRYVEAHKKMEKRLTENKGLEEIREN